MNEPYESSSINPLPHQVVRASAGAGKTYQLTTRYLDLLVRQQPPQNILATTFTRKAAGEVLARVLGRLASACADDTARDDLARALDWPSVSHANCIAMLRTLTDGLNRLAVGTIDGFFNRAAKALAMDLDLPPDPRLIDEGSPLAKQMRFDAIQAALGEQAADEDGMHTLIEMLRRLHHDTAQRSVTETIDRIVVSLGEVYQAYPDRALWTQLPDVGQLNPELLVAATDAFVQMADALPMNKSNKPYATFKKAYEALLAHVTQGQWDSVLSNGLVAKINNGQDRYAGAPITDDWQSVIKPLVLHAKALRLKALADQTGATYDLLALFDRHYRALRHAQGVMLFSDLTHVLAGGLPEMGAAGLEDLYYRLDARVTHLLLDEFQDTSQQQWKVLGPFADEIVMDAEASRSLFCVGDTKQAIYGWRGGCAELFEVVEDLPGVESQALSKSWRSSQVVLDAVNDVFTSLADNPALADCREAACTWQEGFDEHRAMKDTLPGHVVLHTTAGDASSGGSVDEDENDSAAPPDAHADFVARYIAQMTRERPGKTIGVLMRARAKAQTLMHALRKHGIAAAEEGGNPIANDPAVAAVLAAIQFADHPGDRVARFHTINSPVGELLGLDTQARPEEAARALRRELIDQGYASVIAGWAKRLAPSCDALSLRRLMQLVELAEQYDENGATLRPSFFVQTMQAAKVEDASPALVRIMTIHASKGLEFDAVVLSDLDGVLSAQDQRDLIVLDRDSPIGDVRGVYRRLPKALAELTPQLEHAHAQRANEKRTEDLCLLYVAMTRAKQSLHMLVRPLKQSKGGKISSAGLTNLSYAAILRQALGTGTEDEGIEPGQCLYEAGDAQWAGPIKVTTDGWCPEFDQSTERERLSESQKTSTRQQSSQTTLAHASCSDKAPLLPQPTGRPARSWAKASPSQLTARVYANDLLNLTPNTGQRYGTIIHGMLESIGFTDDGLPILDTLVQAVGPGDANGFDPTQIAASLLANLEKPDIQTVLQRNGADTLWRERRFITRVDGQLITGSFDRVHLWHEGDQPTRALLIDYKTDRVNDNTITTVTDRYVDQLRLYRKALCTMLNLPPEAITMKLLFVGDSRTTTVT